MSAPDGWAVVLTTGEFIGIWNTRQMAELVAAPGRSGNTGRERVRPMVFDDKPDPLAQALNEGDGTYRP